MKGKLIVCEGLDCSGKTTAIKQIINSDPRYVYSKGIGSDSKFGRIARKFPSTLMFLSELVYNIYSHVNPNLKKGRIILQDRYDISMTSFVPNTNRWYNQLLIALTKPLIPKPDVVVYFYLPLKERIKRLKEKGKKYEIMLAENPNIITLREKVYEEWYKRFNGPKIKINTKENNVQQTARKLKAFINDLITESL